MKARVLVLVAVAVLAFAGGTLLTSRPVTYSLLHPQVVAASRDAPTDEGVDAYGNEVTNAVAEYSFDPTGSPYELHSPHIELPRLGSPQS